MVLRRERDFVAVSIRANIRDGSYEWLIAILVSWWIPFQLIGEWKVRYWMSLVLWGLPVALLLPRFLRDTHRGSRRRQALVASAAYVCGAGVVLDFVFGAMILDFDPCPPDGKAYLRCLPALGGAKIPIEEYLFYILGALAVVLVYVWADMHWLDRYNVRQRQGLIPRPGHLVEVSPRVALLGGAVLAAGIAWRSYYQTLGGKSIPHWTDAIPAYYTFLVAFAFLPLMLVYRGVKDFVNWRAFSLTGLYVLLTAAVWEVTLGLPGRWWFYKDEAMIGKVIPAWSQDKAYPIEALLVWIAVVFVGIFLYEFWETYYYDERPPRVKLFTGTFPPPTPPPPPPPPEALGLSIVMRGSPDIDARLHRLRHLLADGMLDESAVQVVVVTPAPLASEGLPEHARVVAMDDIRFWRVAGARETRYPTLCFVDESLTVAPRALRMIREVLESPRIVGGSTSATLDATVTTRLHRAVVTLLKAWLTALDRGVVFCRRVDFEALSDAATAGSQDEFLLALRALGRESRRVLTRLTTDGVTQRSMLSQ